MRVARTTSIRTEKTQVSCHVIGCTRINYPWWLRWYTKTEWNLPDWVKEQNPLLVFDFWLRAVCWKRWQYCSIYSICSGVNGVEVPTVADFCCMNWAWRACPLFFFRGCQLAGFPWIFQHFSFVWPGRWQWSHYGLFDACWPVDRNLFDTEAEILDCGSRTLSDTKSEISDCGRLCSSTNTIFLRISSVYNKCIFRRWKTIASHKTPTNIVQIAIEASQEIEYSFFFKR